MPVYIEYMKKRFFIFNSILCLLLTGCSSSGNSTASAASTVAESNVSYKEDDYLVFNQSCFSNNGYFYFDTTGINFVDLGNMKNYPLEHHQAEDIGEADMSSIGLIWFYDRKAGYTKLEGEGGYLSFYTCDIDGTNETELARYSEDSSVIVGTSRKGILYQGTMYLSIQSAALSSSNNAEVLCSLDMKTGTIKEITPVVKSNGSGMELCFVYENALYFMTQCDLDTDEFTDYYNLYRYDLNEESVTLLRNDLPSTFSLNTAPASQYIYGSLPLEDPLRNGEALQFYQYDLESNEVTEKTFTYSLKDDESMWPGAMFDDFVQIRVMNDAGTYMDTIFYHPETGETEYYSQDAYFIPSYKNDTYVFGYTSDTSEDYLFSLLTIDEFNNREFDKAIKVIK